MGYVCQSTGVVSGDDSWSLLSGVLQLLQWKGDVKESQLLLAPLSRTLKFLLQQLKGIYSREADGLQDLEPQSSEDDVKWFVSFI